MLGKPHLVVLIQQSGCRLRFRNSNSAATGWPAAAGTGALFLACLQCTVAHAQADADRARDQRTIEALNNRVQELEQRLRVLEDLVIRLRETGARAAAPSSATSAEAAAVPPTAAQRASGHDRDELPIAKTPIALRGFADVGWGKTSGGGNSGFKDISLSLYLTPRLSDSVKSVVELVFERNSDGKLSTDLERLQVGYTFHRGVTVWLGRFHTPLGYWNTAFHHGQQLQTAVLRPQLIEFEDRGGILPVHTIGLWGTGALNAGSGRVTYDLFGGNSPSIDGGTLNPNDLGGAAPGASVGSNIGYLFGEVADGLKIGAHAYRADVHDDAPVGSRVRLGILGAYVVLDTPVWEVIGEYYHFRNADLSGGTGRHHSWAGFVQAGLRIGLWTPYARLETASLDQTDTYFALQSSARTYRRSAVGLRYEITPDSAIKSELNRTRRDESPNDSNNQLLMHWAIRF